MRTLEEIKHHAIKELYEKIDRIEQRLNADCHPSEEVKTKILQELDAIETFVRNHIQTIKELLSINAYIM